MTTQVLAGTGPTWTLSPHDTQTLPEHAGTIVEVNGERLAPPVTWYGTMTTFAPYILMPIAADDTMTISIYVNGTLYSTVNPTVGNHLLISATDPSSTYPFHMYIPVLPSGQFVFFGNLMVSYEPIGVDLDIVVVVTSASLVPDYTVASGVLTINVSLSGGDYITATTFSNASSMGLETVVYPVGSVGDYIIPIPFAKDYLLVAMNGLELSPDFDYEVEPGSVGWDSLSWDSIPYDLDIPGSVLNIFTPTSGNIVATVTTAPAAREEMQWIATTDTPAFLRMEPLFISPGNPVLGIPTHSASIWSVANNQGTSMSSGGSTTTITVTAGANESIIIGCEIGTASVSTLPVLNISGLELVWVQVGTTGGQAFFNGRYHALTVWRAFTPIAVTGVVTITSTVTIDNAATIYASYNNTRPPYLDPNTNLPVEVFLTNATQKPEELFSTTNESDLIFTFIGSNYDNLDWLNPTYPPGSTVVDTVMNDGGTYWAYLGLMTVPVTTPQTNLLYGSTFDMTSNWNFVGHALTGPPGVPQYSVNFEYVRITPYKAGSLVNVLNPTDTQIVINLFLEELSPKLQDPNPLSQPTSNGPGVIWIGGERIEYFGYSRSSNVVTLAGLRRGTRGTTIAEQREVTVGTGTGSSQVYDLDATNGVGPVEVTVAGLPFTSFTTMIVGSPMEVTLTAPIGDYVTVAMTIGFSYPAGTAVYNGQDTFTTPVPIGPPVGDREIFPMHQIIAG